MARRALDPLADLAALRAGRLDASGFEPLALSDLAAVRQALTAYHLPERGADPLALPADAPQEARGPLPRPSAAEGMAREPLVPRGPHGVPMLFMT